MKKYLITAATLLNISIHHLPNSYAQTPVPLYIRSYPIGAVLASPSGLPLPDGNIIHAEFVSIGPGIHNANVAPLSGSYNQPGNTEIGGPFNGINNISSTNVANRLGPGLTISAYVGSKVPQDFTNISGSAANLDNGLTGTQKFNKGIGFHIWFDRKISHAQFLFLDIDGNVDTNGEWNTSFAYSDNDRIPPDRVTVTLGPATTLVTNAPANTLSANWLSLVQTKQGIAVDGFNGSIANPVVIRRGATTGNEDPDDVNAQILYDFNVRRGFNHFYNLWGTCGNVTSGVQNSGISPFVVSVFPEYGDAPASFNVFNSVTSPAVHGIYTTLKIGDEIDTDIATNSENADGDEIASADNVDDEDGIIVSGVPNSAAPSIDVLQTSSSEVIPSYSVLVATTNDIGTTASLIGWIDWNNNGTFEASEASNVVSVPPTGVNNYVLSWSNVTMSYPDINAYPTKTFLRIRLATPNIPPSTAPNLSIATPTGPMDFGEVEDYPITLTKVLPVTLSDFTGKVIENSNALITWATTEEQQNKEFEIQRSNDALNYKKVGTVAGKGNSVQVNHYSFLDLINYKGQIRTFYYRLKQIDFDGTTFLSKAIALKMGMGDPSSYSLKPTLVKHNGDLTIEGDDIRKVKLFTSSGQMLSEQSCPSLKKLTMNLSGLQCGLYIVAINDQKAIKIVVE